MTDLQIQSALLTLQSAAASPLGIVVRASTFGDSSRGTSPALRAKGLLYRVRRDYPSPEFRVLQVRLSPSAPDDELWIIRMDKVGSISGEEQPDRSEPTPISPREW